MVRFVFVMLSGEARRETGSENRESSVENRTFRPPTRSPPCRDTLRQGRLRSAAHALRGWQHDAHAAHKPRATPPGVRSPRAHAPAVRVREEVVNADGAAKDAGATDDNNDRVRSRIREPDLLEGLLVRQRARRGGELAGERPLSRLLDRLPVGPRVEQIPGGHGKEVDDRVLKFELGRTAKARAQEASAEVLTGAPGRAPHGRGNGRRATFSAERAGAAGLGTSSANMVTNPRNSPRQSLQFMYNTTLYNNCTHYSPKVHDCLTRNTRNTVVSGVEPREVPFRAIDLGEVALRPHPTKIRTHFHSKTQRPPVGSQ